MVQCHACDGGDISRTASLASYVHEIQKRHPGRNRKNKPIGWAACQPTLIKGQTNRIMVYRGSFNPPHVGHLNLLTYAYDHGGQDIRAAIILTSSDESLETKFREFDGTMRLSKKDRQKLWKNDDRLPLWAWVWEDSSDEWKELRRRLKQKARSAGYEVEYLILYGPDGLNLFDNVGGLGRDARFHTSDINQILVCDVSREAGLPDQSAEELRTLCGFEPWRKLELDKQIVEDEAGADAENMLAILKVKAPEEYQRAVERGDHTAKKPVTALMNDSEHIWVCHKIGNPDIQWRFVRANRLAYPEYEKSIISSTILRAAMKPSGEDLEKADLEARALSPDLLLSMRSKWISRLPVAEESRKENDQPLAPDKVGFPEAEESRKENDEPLAPKEMEL